MTGPRLSCPELSTGLYELSVPPALLVFWLPVADPDAPLALGVFAVAVLAPPLPAELAEFEQLKLFCVSMNVLYCGAL